MPEDSGKWIWVGGADAGHSGLFLFGPGPVPPIDNKEPREYKARVYIDGETANLVAGGNTVGEGELGAAGDLSLYRRDGNRLALSGREFASVNIDGQRADIVAGGHGADGDLFLFHNDGDRESPSYNTYRRRARIHLGAANATIAAGGHGKDGDLFLFDEQSLRSSALAAEATIHLNGGSANIALGGSGHDGGLVLRDSEGTEAVRIQASPAEVRIRDWSIGVPDYVFAADYHLPSLSDLKQHIDQHGHLPGLPSEQAVAEDGVELCGLVNALWKKVEELTLYALMQEQALCELRGQVLSLLTETEPKAHGSTRQESDGPSRS